MVPSNDVATDPTAFVTSPSGVVPGPLGAVDAPVLGWKRVDIAHWRAARASREEADRDGAADTAALLAGWWRRFGGYVLDVIIVDVAERIVLKIIEKIDVALRTPLSPGLHSPTLGAQVAMVVANVGILVGYSFVLLRFRGQTVGMMATGVRAVDRSSGAALDTPQTWRRVLTFFMIVTLWDQIAFVINSNHVTGPTPIAATIFTVIAAVGLLTTGLWPTGSPLNQTLQDKAADTIVIRTRR